LKEYELTVIAKADMPEEEMGKLQNKYEALMVKDGGEILKKDIWGLRKMVHPINKHHRGNYVFYDFVGQSEHLTEMERLMRIDEGVLRYLSVSLGGNVDVEARKIELAKVPVAPSDDGDYN
jgi:small subunit ribosomal protein S6